MRREPNNDQHIAREALLPGQFPRGTFITKRASVSFPRMYLSLARSFQRLHSTLWSTNICYMSRLSIVPHPLSLPRGVAMDLAACLLRFRRQNPSSPRLLQLKNGVLKMTLISARALIIRKPGEVELVHIPWYCNPGFCRLTTVSFWKIKNEC